MTTRSVTACECGNHCFVAATRGFMILISPDDVGLVAGWSWSVKPNGRTAYAQRSAFREGKKQTIRLHREIIDAGRSWIVDHVNGNGMDNRRENIRLATPAQNTVNRRFRGNASGFLGVYAHRKRWTAYVRKEHGHRYGGSHDTPMEAAIARDRIAYEEYGEFAVLNFPQFKNMWDAEPSVLATLIPTPASDEGEQG